jgi:F-type H+/Na+-transporting ATPase subunit alpha
MLKFEDALQSTNEIGTIEELYGGSVVAASGLPSASPGEVVIFEQGQMGRVFSLQDEIVEILILTQSEPVQTGTKVARTGSPFRLPVGNGLLGRAVTPLGANWLTQSHFKGMEEERSVDALPPSLTERRLVDVPFISGVSMVDLVIPLGRGQRELIIGDHKVGKTQLLLQSMRAHILRGGVGVYCGIAKRATEIASFLTYAKAQKIDERMVFVFAGAADPTGLVYLCPYSAMTIAEYFKDQGKDVLLILDDLTIHAKYYRELSLLARRYPGRSSYPGDIFSIHAGLLERAGQFAQGSITCLPVAESVLSDISGYIQTNLMSMTDGHVFFDSEYYNQGKRPAINPFVSVTRVGHQTQTPLMRSISHELSGFLVEHEKLKELVHFGGELTDRVKKGLDKGVLLEAVFNQSDDLVVPLPVGVLLVALVYAEIIEASLVVNMGAIRLRLIHAYEGDRNWKHYIDSIMGMNTFGDLIAKITTDKSMLTSLIEIH